MDIFANDPKNANKLELARKDIAEAGGPAIGSGALASKKRQDYVRDQAETRNANMTALQIMLADPAYREAYERVTLLLEDVQQKLDSALLENAAEREAMESGAAKLGDGSPVFLSQDGQFYTVTGQRVPADQAPKSVPPGAASWEDYQANKARGAELARIQDERLNPIREKVSDPEQPPKKDALPGFEDELRDIGSLIDAEPNSAPQTPQPTPEQQVSAPELTFPSPIS